MITAYWIALNPSLDAVEAGVWQDEEEEEPRMQAHSKRFTSLLIFFVPSLWLD